MKKVKEFTLSLKSALILISIMVATPPTTIQLLTWIGLNTEQKRNSIISDFMSAPEVLEHLHIEDAYGINVGFHNHHKRVIARERFTMMRIQVKRLNT